MAKLHNILGVSWSRLIPQSSSSERRSRLTAGRPRSLDPINAFIRGIRGMTVIY